MSWVPAIRTCTPHWSSDTAWRGARPPQEALPSSPPATTHHQPHSKGTGRPEKPRPHTNGPSQRKPQRPRPLHNGPRLAQQLADQTHFFSRPAARPWSSRAHRCPWPDRSNRHLDSSGTLLRSQRGGADEPVEVIVLRGAVAMGTRGQRPRSTLGWDESQRRTSILRAAVVSTPLLSEGPFRRGSN